MFYPAALKPTDHTIIDHLFEKTLPIKEDIIIINDYCGIKPTTDFTAH